MEEKLFTISKEKVELSETINTKKNELSPERFVKIIHSRLDRENYEKVINGQAKDSVDSIVLDSEASKDNPATESGILKCYKYFCKRFDPNRDGNPEYAKIIWQILVGEKQNFLVNTTFPID